MRRRAPGNACPILPLALLALAGPSAGREEPYDPARFEASVLARGLDRPLELAVTPDGRVLWVELGGKLRLWRPDTGEIVEAGRLEVFADQENGLLGLALDPGFAQNGELYLLYSPIDFPGQHLSRFVLDGDHLNLESEELLLAFEEQRRECCHHAGSLAFAPDGCLFVATGDNTHPGGDAQGYAPLDERADRFPFDAQRGSANTQSLTGKILRIRPTADGYAIPPGNLFDDPSEGRPEIYVMGCRNPWRISVDPLTGFLYWGEVGPDANDDGERGPRGYDEVNQARSAGNFGWPYFIADNRAYPDVDFETGAIGAAQDPERPQNHSPNNTGAVVLPPARPAWIYYPYGPSEAFPMLDGPGGRTACAGPVYRFDPELDSPTELPAELDGTLFVYEWSRHWIMAVRLDEDSRPASIERFLPQRELRRPVDLALGPEGALYLLEFGTTWGTNEDSALVRIDYVRGNRAPRARASVAGNIGAGPLRVRASSAGTSDADGDALTYAWRVPPASEVLSTLAEPELEFRSPGAYTLELEVRDPSGARSTASVPVLVGNDPPEVRFERPADGSFFDPDAPIDWLVHVADAEDGDSEEEALAMLERVTVEATFVRGAPPGAEAEGDAGDPGLALMRASDCFNCHAAARRIVGPSLQEIAARYRDVPGAVEASVERVRKGSSGVWGDVPMLPHPSHSGAELRQMVSWIHRQSAEGAAREVQRGLRGLLAPAAAPGSYLLEARYADQGGEGVGSLTGGATVRLRSRAVEAEHFWKRSGTSTLDSATASGGRFIGAIDDGNELSFGPVNLAGLDRVALRVSSAGAGGLLELRADHAGGPLVARAEIVPNGAWESWYELVLPLADPGGTRELVVVFRNAESPSALMNLDRMVFLRPGETPRAYAGEGE